MSQPHRIAIIGAGPAGFYTAEALLKQAKVDISIDLIDALPAPYGLVRYGVAPDHQKIKSVTKIYEKLFGDKRLRYLGNVHFGRDLSYEELKAHYDAVVYTVGAASDRQLGIAGEDLGSSLSATQFVAWYNGHPDYVNLNPKLDMKAVAVIGMGNVAVDVCRILARHVDELAKTDIADHALEALRESQVEDIYMIGRRGPAQTKFTTKELRELAEMVNADVIVKAADLELDELSQAEAEKDINTKNNLKVLHEIVDQGVQNKPRRLHIRFLQSPKEILGEREVEGLVLEHNRLINHNGESKAVGTGEFETLPVGMVLRSVGYRGEPLAGVPFHEKWGIIPNEAGRVSTLEGHIRQGEYCAGWIKRGPSGVIGSNKPDAVETAEKLLEDLATLPRIDQKLSDPQNVDKLLKLKGVEVINFEDWQHLNALELKAGEVLGRPRVKFVTRSEMIEACTKSPV
ncbi:MAG: FAD-dependent oxidoreductase [Deinococcales bacterium]